MDVRVLRYFLAVAREQTISGAAEVLHMTQPPLSKQLRELEEELGKQLFYRGKRRITLTKEGMLLRKRAEEIVSLVEKTKAEVSASDEQITGDIHIGGGETESMRPIAQAVEQVQQRHPGICVHFFSGDFLLKLQRRCVTFRERKPLSSRFRSRRKLSSSSGCIAS